jgi:hypothetical protein
VGALAHRPKTSHFPAVTSGSALCRDDRKQSLNRNFVPELLQRGGDVVSCAKVERVLLRGQRAIGVVGCFKHPVTAETGAPLEIRARHGVIVAASVTGSPVLLLRSGLRHRALGHGFRAHPGLPISGCYDEVVDMTKGATQGWASGAFHDRGLKLESIGVSLDMFAGRVSGGGPELMERLLDFRHTATWAIACRADSVGRVSVGWGGRPVVHYSLGPGDLQRVREGLHQLARLHVTSGAPSAAI